MIFCIIQSIAFVTLLERHLLGRSQIRLGPNKVSFLGLVQAFLDDSRIVIPSSALLCGEYGHNDVCVGVPVVLGAKGIVKIIELELNDELSSKFDTSVNSIKEGIKILEDNGFF